MQVKRIVDADMYRDGGSYGFTFYADDGRCYEFFLATRAFEEPRSEQSHRPPAIYAESVNDAKLVQQLTWGEARVFVAPLSFAGSRFAELVAVVLREGRRE